MSDKIRLKGIPHEIPIVPYPISTLPVYPCIIFTIKEEKVEKRFTRKSLY